MKNHLRLNTPPSARVGTSRIGQYRRLSLLTTSAVASLVSFSFYACSGDDSTQSGNGITPPHADASVTDGNAGSNDGANSGDSADGASDSSAPPTGPCSALPGRVVYIESGDTQENLLKHLGRKLRDENITIAFNLTGSCTLIQDAYTSAKMVPNGTLKYIPSAAENPNWTPAQAEATCTTDPAGAPVDLAISALYVPSCSLGAPPAGSNVGLIQGPIQPYTFIVPTASDQTAIWAEEAYYAFGFGNANPLAPQYDPWSDQMSMFIRPPTKSTLVATAKNIGVPPNKWKGVAEPASSDVVNAVTNAATPEKAIGILGAEVYDGARGKGIKSLAFQAFHQSHAYLPDSTSASFDKQNVRDGHYTLWSPTVYLTKVDGTNTPQNPVVKYIVDTVLGNAGATPPDGGAPIDFLKDVVKVGLVPQCAMQVTRSTDGGDLSPYTPPTSCTCAYESLVAGATGTPAGCTPCMTNADCAGGGGTCSHAFCEPDGTTTQPPGDAGTSCFSGKPTSHIEIINACTTAQSFDKTIVLPSADGGLEPLP